MKKHKSHFNWTWVLFILFFILTVIDFRFGIAGLICMILPLIQVFRGKGRSHCSLHCPRGSFLVNTMKKISFGKSIPDFMKTNWFKSAVFALIMILFTISMYRSGGDIEKIGFSIFRMVTATSIVAIALGIIFKPRSWCTVCPMGFASTQIARKRR